MLIILTQDRRKVIITSDGNSIETDGEKSGRIILTADKQDKNVLGEYSSGYMARAVLEDLYNAMGGNVKYKMPTIGEAKRLHTGVI